jgi:tRNA dimethylallyltransferase
MAAMLENAILIAGPTASGKSGLAIDVARATGGTIVNADSMLVYSVLRILTARPDAADLARAPHRLYGHVHPAEAYSTGRWLREVEALAGEEAFAGGPAIFVGGTGLYFKALLGGLSPMPDIPAPIREAWRCRLEEEGSQALHAVLAERDAHTAAMIRPGDGQRLVRALEVLEASGRSIAEWQAERGRPLVNPGSARRLVLEPERKELNARIEARFDRMIAEGALEEVRTLLEFEVEPSMPAMKAIGVRELAAVLEERIGMEEAATRAKAATRQYAKRQTTWFRHQLDESWSRHLTPESVDPHGFERSG